MNISSISNSTAAWGTQVAQRPAPAPTPADPEAIAVAREDVKATFSALAGELGVEPEALLAQLRTGDATSLAGLNSSYGGTTHDTSGLLVDTSA